MATLLAADGTTRDPVIAIRRRMRALIGEIISEVGWTGPPFDPTELASYLGLKTEYSYDGFTDEQDAFISGNLIVVNANRSPVRQRFSIAHEIVHNVLPDTKDTVHSSARWRESKQNAELEWLCQVGASEILLPEHEFSPRLRQHGLSLDTILYLHQAFDASVEASAHRAVDLTEKPAALVILRPVMSTGGRTKFVEGGARGYQQHLALGVSRSYSSTGAPRFAIRRGSRPPETSVAIDAWKRAAYPPGASLTYSAVEVWPTVPRAVQCVCEAMVLPKRSRAPYEVLCLLTVPDKSESGEAQR